MNSLTQTWDEEEEQRDFESLLDPTFRHGNNDPNNPAAAKPTAPGVSKGMFLESWMNVFARTLKFLSKINQIDSIKIIKRFRIKFAKMQ